MEKSIVGLLRMMGHGLGLRITLAYLPPVALAWTFYFLYLGQLAEHAHAALPWAIGLGLAGVAFGSLAVFWLVLTTIPPVRRMVEVTAALAAGRLATEIPYRERSDETGELARALEVFKRNFGELEACASLKSERASDLGRKRELLSLADALEGEVEGTVRDVMGQAEAMTRSTGEATAAIRRMEGLYRTLSEASGETLTNVAAVAASTDELAAASREIGEQMARTIAITRNAVAKADEANGTMRDLSAVTVRIAEVLDLINAIAGQTNLLALNATIEAARAGEAGKGFAVVAAEVKGLANQTTKAVGTISELVDGIRAATDSGVAAIEAVGRTIDDVNTVAGAVAAAVEEQEASTREISSRAQNATSQAKRVSHDAAGISTEVEHVDSLAGILEKGAGDVTTRLADMERRLSGILAHTVGGKNAAVGKAGQAMAGVVEVAGGKQPCRFEELSLAGARLVGTGLAAGAAISPVIEGFGPVSARVREAGPAGAVLDFVLDELARARLGEFLFGHEALDQPYIALAKAKAREVEQAFEAALSRGECTLDNLFDRDYQPIAGTNPLQVRTRFLDLAERVLPSIQEPVLKADSKIVFAVAANQDGYVAVHHAHCSKPQGPDPVWNAANCRQRRLFNNRAELAAATHRQDHLLQTYIRDMGGGNVMLLKDASVPITVRGRHWGGMRLGYKL